MTTDLTEDEIWKRRRDQPNPPTPGNPAFSVRDIHQAIESQTEP